MNFKKLTSLAPASLMGLNVLAVMPKASAANTSSEAVSQSVSSEKEEAKLIEKAREEIAKNDDLKKEATELKKELSECKDENKFSELKSVTLKFLKLLGKCFVAFFTTIVAKEVVLFSLIILSSYIT